MATIERWNAARNPERDLNWLNPLVEEPFGSIFLGKRPDNVSVLSVDVTESEKEYQLQASLPGYKPEEIKVDINQDVVTIRGEHREEMQEEKKDHYIYHERYVGTFYRQIRLPQSIESSKAKAELKNGVLTVMLPKVQHVNAMQVPVSAS